MFETDVFVVHFAFPVNMGHKMTFSGQSVACWIACDDVINVFESQDPQNIFKLEMIAMRSRFLTGVFFKASLQIGHCVLFTCCMEFTHDMQKLCKFSQLTYGVCLLYSSSPEKMFRQT